MGVSDAQVWSGERTSTKSFRMPSAGALLCATFAILTASPGWCAFHVVATTLYLISEPSLAWAAREAINALQCTAGSLADLAWPHARVYALIGLVGLVLRFGEHTALKIYKATIVLALQRRLAARHVALPLTDHVTRMMYDCFEAKKALSPFFTSLWRSVFRVVAVVGW